MRAEAGAGAHQSGSGTGPARKRISRITPASARSIHSMRRGRRFCSTAATSRLVSKIGRPTSALSTERSLDFLRAKGLDAEDLLLVSTLVKTNAGVESIDVSGNGFGAGGAESLVAIVRSSPQLSKLDASQNNLRASAALLAEAAASHGSLRSLAMSANAIGATLHAHTHTSERGEVLSLTPPVLLHRCRRGDISAISRMRLPRCLRLHRHRRGASPGPSALV